MKEKEIEYGVLQDECLDMLIRAAFKWQEIKTDQDILSLSEEELSTEEMGRSIQLYERFREEKAVFESKARKRLHIDAAKRISFRIAGAAACIAFLLSIAAPFAIAHIEPIRTRVLNLLVEIGDRYTSVSMDSVAIPENWQGRYYMHYLPDGFEMVLSDDRNCHVEYANRVGDVIKFTERPEIDKLYIDSERSAVNKIMMNGHELSVVEKDGKCTFIWNNGFGYFSLISNISRDELLKVAQSVRMIER